MEEDFSERVAEAAAHLQDHTWLASSPLASALGLTGPRAGEELSGVLASAIRELRPAQGQPDGSPAWRQYRHLLMRHVLGASPAQIAHELNVSERQARRDHLDALHALAARLKARSLPAGEATAAHGDAAAANGAPIDYDEAVQAEVTRIAVARSRQPVPVEATIEGVFGTLAALAAGRGISFTLTPSAMPCFVATDHAVLRQILLNLLTWMIEAERDRRIAVSVGEGGAPPEVHVALGVVPSAGQPAAPPNRPPLDPDDPRLAVCRQLLVTQGGSLDLGRDAGGSPELRVSLPAAWTGTVLVVDDNPDFLRLFQRYLGDRAFRLHHASSGDEAIRLARALQPDVITLDVMMPSQDGWEILQALRSHGATATIPVIVCSVLREEALARSLGADGFLTKPIRQPALLAALERCLPTAGAGVRRG